MIALTGTLALAQQSAGEARKSVETAQAQLDAEDRVSLADLLDDAREATKHAIEQVQSNQDDQNRLRISLDLRGEQGLHTDRDAALDRFRHIERGHESTKARAEAARLLYENVRQASPASTPALRGAVQGTNRPAWSHRFRPDLRCGTRR